MFDRKKYKTFAKIQLKGRWGIPVLMTAIVMIVDFLFAIPNIVKIFQSEDFWYTVNGAAGSYEVLPNMMEIFNYSAPFLVTFIQGIVSAIFNVASINVYLKMTMSPEPVSFSGFLEGLNQWGRAVLAHLWRALWSFLWMFLTAPLLSIPGIIKSISYSQVMYIITEHKDISVTKALKISMLITRGHKGELFIMYLSFIGWSLLAGLTFGIGFLFLNPYISMTQLNAYHAMLQEAIENGSLRMEDLSE